MSTILIVSPEPWDAHAVSKHHYARTLAERGHDVLFLNPPCKTIGGILVKEVAGCPNLRRVSGRAVARGLRFWPRHARQAVERRWLARLERCIAARVDTIWLFENSRFFDLAFAGDRLKIYHQVDLNQQFNPAMAARTADVCFCTTDAIRRRLAEVRPDVHKIHHGAVTSVADGHPAPGWQPRERLRAAYVGNLDMPYIDDVALARIVMNHPEIKFDFVGGFSEKTPLHMALRGAANVTWWGKLPFTDVPGIISKADLLLVAYRRERQQEQASPHKFMEYLLTGNVVVCSYTEEYADKRHLVAMADADEDVAAVFDRAVDELAEHNRPELREARRAFALENSYPRQLDKIEKIVLRETGRSL